VSVLPQVLQPTSCLQYARPDSHWSKTAVLTFKVYVPTHKHLAKTNEFFQKIMNDKLIIINHLTTVLKIFIAM